MASKKPKVAVNPHAPPPPVKQYIPSLKDEKELLKARIVPAAGALKKSWMNILHDADGSPHDAVHFTSPELATVAALLDKAEAKVLKYFKIV